MGVTWAGRGLRCAPRFKTRSFAALLTMTVCQRVSSPTTILFGALTMTILLVSFTYL
jgi:hypothetical protein